MAKRAGTVGTLLTALSIGLLGMMSSVAVAHPHEPPAGTLDAGFGNGGVALTPTGGMLASPGNMVVEEDGKTVVGGSFAGSLTLFRYRRDGALDPTFGTGGMASTPPLVSGGPTLDGIALQRDGSVVVVGTVGQGTGAHEVIMLVRFRHDGQMDDAFGTNGVVMTDLGPATIARAAAVAVQGDGRIVVVGLTATNPDEISNNLLVRYDRDGALDGTFGVGGVVISDFGGAAGQILLAVAFANDGKIVVAGSSKQHTSGFTGSLARFNHDGTLDSTFGSGGVVIHPIAGLSPFGAVAVQHDGRILVAGNEIARFLVDGELDANFGVGGLAPIPAGQGGVNTVAIDRCGRIVAAGLTFPGLLVLRYDRDGAPDPEFGTGGATTTTLDGITLQNTALALAPGGDIVVSGTANPVANPSNASFAVARYEADDNRGCRCDNDRHW